MNDDTELRMDEAEAVAALGSLFPDARWLADEFEDLPARAPRPKRADEDVRVEDHSHETIRKISSSVRGGPRRPNPPLDMRATCMHAVHMSKMIQIRNVPDSLHRKLKTRAAHDGKSLSDYLLAEMVRFAALPTREEMLARLHSRAPVKLSVPAAQIIREGREA